MAKSKTVQVVMSEALVEEVDEFVRRLNLPGLGGPTRSSVIRHMVTLALPLMRAEVERAAPEPPSGSVPAGGQRPPTTSENS